MDELPLDGLPVYIGKIEYKRVSLVKVTITKETPQTISVDKDTLEVLIGQEIFFSHHRDRKSGFKIFNELDEAKAWAEGETIKLISVFAKIVTDHQKVLEKVRAL